MDNLIKNSGNTFRVRMLALVKLNENGNNTAFGRKVGTSGDNIRNYCNGKSKPNADVLANIVNVYRINGHWLLTGSGNMKLTHQQHQEIENNPEIITPDLEDSFSNKELVNTLRLATNKLNECQQEKDLLKDKLINALEKGNNL